MSYDYFLNMTWAEFKIRLFAYRRMHKEKLILTREVCYQIYISGYYGKGKPLSKDRYWNIGNKKPSNIHSDMLERIKRANKKYKTEKAVKNG